MLREKDVIRIARLFRKLTGERYKIVVMDKKSTKFRDLEKLGEGVYDSLIDKTFLTSVNTIMQARAPYKPPALTLPAPSPTSEVLIKTPKGVTISAISNHFNPCDNAYFRSLITKEKQ